MLNIKYFSFQKSIKQSEKKSSIVNEIYNY